MAKKNRPLEKSLILQSGGGGLNQMECSRTLSVPPERSRTADSRAGFMLDTELSECSLLINWEPFHCRLSWHEESW